MKLEAFFRSVWTQTKEAVSRYPLSMVLILAGFGLGQYMLWTFEWEYTSLEEILVRLQMTIWVVLPLFTGIQLFRLRKWTLLLALLLGASFYWLQIDVFNNMAPLRAMLWGLAFYSTLFFLPKWKKNANNGFWVYSERLVFVFGLALICTLILTVSLQLALFSIRELFEVNLDFKWDQSIWLFGFSFFLPVFVHIGLPHRYGEFESFRDYPHFVKPIAYYLLLPISFLYFGILGLYVGQILITREWPSGQVAYPVLYFSMLIFATYFLSYPWQKLWLKWSFAVLLPFLAVYFIALSQRISQYGLTEMRYLGVLVGLLLTWLCLYYLRSKAKRLQMAFFVTALTAFFFSFGPWGVFSLSVSSQISRLEMLLTEIGALKDGGLKNVSADSVADAVVIEISGIVQYLAERDRLVDLEKWGDIELGVRSQPEVDVPSFFMKQIGLEFNYWGHYVEDPLYFQYASRWPLFYDVSGYDALFAVDQSFDQYGYASNPLQYSWNSDEENLYIFLDADGVLHITFEDSEFNLALLDLHRQLDSTGVLGKANFASSDLSLSAENDEIRVKVYIESMDGAFTGDEEMELSRMYVRGHLLLDVK